jgi:hypothetical protein
LAAAVRSIVRGGNRCVADGPGGRE